MIVNLHHAYHDAQDAAHHSIGKKNKW